jgi:hypothetical protein
MNYSASSQFARNPSKNKLLQVAGAGVSKSLSIPFLPSEIARFECGERDQGQSTHRHGATFV